MTRWLERWSRPAVPRLRLLCLPPAGGAAHLYRTWGDRLPMDVEVIAAELPGHGTRLAQPPLTQASAVTDRLAAELNALPPLPLVVFGHSMGAIIGLAVCRALRRGAPGWAPAGLIVAGSEARASRRAATPLAAGTDDDLRNFLSSAHGRTAPVLTEPSLVELLLPVLRADLALLAAFGEDDDAPPLACPVRAFGGTDDPLVTAADLQDWAAESDGDFVVEMFPGGHFFVAEAEEAVLPAVQRFLQGRALARPPGTAA